MAGEGGGRVRISKRTVDAALPQASLYRVWDTELRGFGLRVSPGGTKTYFVAYRADGGGRRAAQKEYTVGRHGALTPDQARTKAAQLLSAVQLGGDPQASRAAARREMTFGELCDLYLSEGVTMKKPSTIKDDQRRIEVHLKPLLGGRPLSKVTSADVERLMADIATGKTGVARSPTAASYKAAVRAAKASGLPRPEMPELRTRTSAVARGGRGAATRAVGLLGGIFSFAMKRKLVAENPVRGVKRFADQQRQRYLSEAELVRLNAAMEAGERAGMNPKTVAVIKLLLVTGCRRREIENLRWSEVDLERGCLRLEDSKTGPRRVVLGGPAIEILTSITSTPGSAYVFPGRELTKPYGGVEMVWKTKLRAAAGLDGVRLHDLRHTFASLSVAAGHSLPMTGAMLGHRSTRTTAQYAHLADDPLREAADRTARAAVAAMSGSGRKAAA